MKTLYLIFMLVLCSLSQLQTQVQIDTIVEGMTSLNRVIIDPTDDIVYLTERNSLLRYDLSTPSPIPDVVYTTIPGGELTDMAFIGDELYVGLFHFSGPQIIKLYLPVPVPVAVTVASNVGRVNGLTIRDSSIYFTTSDAGILWHLDLTSENSSSEELINRGIEFPGPLTADGDYLYVSSINGDSLTLVDLASDSILPALLVDNIGHPVGQAVLNGRLYVSSYTTDQILSYSLTDFTAPPRKISIRRPIGLTEDNGSLYVVSDGTRLLRIIDLPGEYCTNAIDINTLFGQEVGMPQVSALYNNLEYTAASNPGDGCFGESNRGCRCLSFERTTWFNFIGDGNTYQVNIVKCNATNYINDAGTQLAVYTGRCNNLVQVTCTKSLTGSSLGTSLQFSTEAGIEYSVILGGYNVDFPAVGEYCLEVTQIGSSSVIDIQDTPIILFPNPTAGLLQLQGVTTQKIEAFNLRGSRVATFEQPGNQVDISAFLAGVYVLRIQDEQGKFFSARVVKE